ncbi:nuclease-related domain-containing protein [Cytobacillus sp. NCCP-133]|uniref:nuclease-related domain-containing protein n=1 Tax=Cytobacillus sp. NCCP-133 TaxID=766848 RepID=UPI002230F8AD|nr:nuclease-related domain-containing protein [Cytobacillus sp. NCCP-133]GLB60030.1 hypothetical protein NCCP133_21620 [Cytobacillus sp. NCCP-133]
MIEKERMMPEINLQLTALLRRMPKMLEGREKVWSELRKRNAGFRGEQKLDYDLSFLNEKEYRIYHGLRLSSGNQFFQIDTLLLTKRFAILLEVKNWNGTIMFEPEFHQLIRIHNDKEEAFQDPISQAEHQSRQLKKWIQSNGFPQIPIEYAVVLSSPSTIIKSPNKQISTKVIHAHRLLNKISLIDETHKLVCIQDKEIKRLNRTLLKNHVPHEVDILNFFKINLDTLLTGVHCPHCATLPVIFHWGKWHCPACKGKSATAHYQAVEDYFLLIKPAISNEEFRNFTHITSVHTAYKLLSAMNLEVGGEKKNRTYKKKK